jgi:predicted component of type VI protein secretion system
MKKTELLLPMLALQLMMIMALSACSSAEKSSEPSQQAAIAAVAAPFAEGAITLNVIAAPDMNAWNEIANSCTLLIIQAEKASTLNKILSNPAQVKVLFSGAGAQESLLKVDRYVAMPGQQTTLHIDRSEHSRQLAIIAGFYPFPQKQHMKLMAIPITTHSQGFWTKEWFAELTPLTLSLTLGSQSITKIQGAPPAPQVQTATPPTADEQPAETAPAQETL